MKTLILRLDVAGQPTGWLTYENCAALYCRDQIAWEAGQRHVTLHGGYSRATGKQSLLRVNTIIATRAVNKHLGQSKSPGLSNIRLFRRDNNTCLYCALVLSASHLTRDHVQPLSRGGQDVWENVVTACRPCNQRKDNRLLKEIGLRLLAVPYAPNLAEGLILANRRILADQMAFLQARVSDSSRFHVS